MAENKTQNRIENDALKKAIDTLRGNASPQNQSRMFDEARKAHYLVPVIFSTDFKPDSNGRITMPKGAQIKFVLVNTNSGKTYFPAFTDIEEAKKLKVTQEGNLQYVVRTLKDYDKMFADVTNKIDGFVINPMTQNIVFPKQLVLALNNVENVAKQQMKAMEEGHVPTGVQVRFAEPTVYPTAMVNAVHDACAEKPEISRVWLKAMFAGQAMSFALIVDTSDKSEEFLSSIRAIAEPLTKNVPVVVLAYTDELEKTAVNNEIPLYDRELGM